MKKSKKLLKVGRRSRRRLQQLVGLTVEDHTLEELALGFIRYETLRRIGPRLFVELHKNNLLGRFFDDLVDELVKPNSKLTDPAP